MLHLGLEDHIATTHRGHGHCIAKGVDVHGMMAEIYGKKTGVCTARAARCTSPTCRWACSAPTASSARAARWSAARRWRPSSRTGGVGVCFFGDGASNQGAIFEAMNLASVWNLPAIFVAENNGYAEATSASWSVACDNIADRAAGFGMPGVIVDGFDFFAVHEAPAKRSHARNGGGPSLVEVKFTRYYGHFEGDAQTYRAPGEVQKLRDEKDCLKQFATRVVRAEVLTTDELRAIDAQVKALIDDAVAQAKAAPLPDAADLLADVYVSYP
jgi:pyruvate dehydrogenase E1 component alpha subunit